MISYYIFLILLLVSTMCFFYRKQFKRGALNSLVFLAFFLLYLTCQDAIEIIVQEVAHLTPIYWQLAVGNIILTFMLVVFPANFILIMLCIIRVLILFPSEINLGIIAIISITSIIGVIIISHCGKTLSAKRKKTGALTNDLFSAPLYILICSDMFLIVVLFAHTFALSTSL